MVQLHSYIDIIFHLVCNELGTWFYKSQGHFYSDIYNYAVLQFTGLQNKKLNT